MKDKGMRYLVGLVVFIMLFVLPLGSWYYLQTGLDYRKDALKELTPKGAFASNVINPALLQSKTSLIHLKNVKEEVIPEIFEQYRESQTFQLLSIQSPKEEYDNWIQIDDFTANAISADNANAGFIHSFLEHLRSNCLIVQCINDEGQFNKPAFRQALVTTLMTTGDGTYVHDPKPTASVPEPGSLGLLAGSLSILGLLAWRHRRNQSSIP